MYRYYAQEGERRVYKKKIVGTVIEFPKRKDAEKAVAQLRVDVNDGAAFAPMNVEQLAAHYKRVELPLKAHSTAEGYKSYLDFPNGASTASQQSRASRSKAGFAN